MIEVMIKRQDDKGWQLCAECSAEVSVRNYVRSQFGLEFEDMEVLDTNHFFFYRAEHGFVQVRLKGFNGSMIKKVDPPKQVDVPKEKPIAQIIVAPWYKRIFR